MPVVQEEQTQGQSLASLPVVRRSACLSFPLTGLSSTFGFLTQCQTPNINTQCLFCFRSDLACGYAEQKMRKEGKKEVDPALPQLERWSLKEGLAVNPPLILLCNSEVSRKSFHDSRTFPRPDG